MSIGEPLLTSIEYGTQMTLPNFLICGAQKAGTTALYKHLSQHPDVFMSRPKETWFFDANYHRGLEWFATHFEGHEGESAIGEATARTMFVPEAPPRVKGHLPEAKLIFVLRNPIDRAYSQFHYSIYTGEFHTERSFHEVIRDDESAFREEMIQRGMYARQLKRFDEYFDCDQMKVIFNEDLRQKTKETVQGVYEFLNVDSSFCPNLTGKHNVTRYPDSLQVYYWIRRSWRPVRDFADTWMPRLSSALRHLVRMVLFDKSRPEMREEDRKYLHDIYSEPNARLEKRTGRDLSHWK
jgi:hypothetical protein